MRNPKTFASLIISGKIITIFLGYDIKTKTLNQSTENTKEINIGSAAKVRIFL